MDFSSMIVFATESNTVILSHDNVNTTQAQTEQPTQQGAAPPPDMFGGGMMVWLVVMVATMWLMIWRPQKKREKKMQDMHQRMRVGDNVITTGGLYGKVVDIGTDVYVLEFGTNKGVRIPVSKNEIVGIKDPNLTPPKIESEEAK